MKEDSTECINCILEQLTEIESKLGIGGQFLECGTMRRLLIEAHRRQDR